MAKEEWAQIKKEIKVQSEVKKAAATRVLDAAEGEQREEKEKEKQQEELRGADHEVSLSDEYTYETETETDSTAEVARRNAKEDL